MLTRAALLVTFLLIAGASLTPSGGWAAQKAATAAIYYHSGYRCGDGAPGSPIVGQVTATRAGDSLEFQITVEGLEPGTYPLLLGVSTRACNVEIPTGWAGIEVDSSGHGFATRNLNANDVGGEKAVKSLYIKVFGPLGAGVAYYNESTIITFVRVRPAPTITPFPSPQ